MWRQFSTFLVLAFVILPGRVLANTEKIIFVAPAAAGVANPQPILEDFDSLPLSPSAPTRRTSLPRVFVSDESPHGKESWFLVKQLKPGQRYEIRVCWAATQPTEFWLDIFRPAANLHAKEQDGGAEVASDEDLVLRIGAAADYFTLNRTLMASPPPVDVDIILDSYIANILPASLGPTLGYIIFLAVGAWYLSAALWKVLNISDPEKAHID